MVVSDLRVIMALTVCEIQELGGGGEHLRRQLL